MPDQNTTKPAQDPSATTTTPPVTPVTDQPTVSTDTPMPDFQSAMTDVPPIPGESTQPTEQVSDSGSAAPSDLPDVTVSTPKKKFGGGKVIATILGILLVVGGVGAGLILTQQRQLFEQKAGRESGLSDLTGKSEGRNVQLFDKNGDKRIDKKDYPDGSLPKDFNGGNLPDKFIGLTADQLKTKCEQDGATWDGSRSACTYPEGFSPNNPPSAYYNLDNTSCGRNLDPGAPACCSDSVKASCGSSGSAGQKVCEPGRRSECNTGGIHCTIDADEADCGGANQGTNEVIGGPTPTPGPTAACQNIKPYSTTWTLLTSSQLSNLAVGDQVNFCVLGVADSGTFDMARFTINGALKPDTTTKRPGTNDFCQSYTIPAATTTFNVSAQIHHTTLGWK